MFGNRFASSDRTEIHAKRATRAPAIPALLNEALLSIHRHAVEPTGPVRHRPGSRADALHLRVQIASTLSNCSAKSQAQRRNFGKRAV